MTLQIQTAPRCVVTRAAVAAANLPPQLRSAVRKLTAPGGDSHFAAPLVVACASEIISGDEPFSAPGGANTRYLVVADVPEPAVPRVAAALQIRRPEHRLHVTRDAGALRRLVIAALRDDPMLGVVDAYVLGDMLFIVTGDFEIRSFPLARIPGVGDLSSPEQGAFEIDSDGSYLYWPGADIHIGMSQILQAVDPMYMADVQIERYNRDRTGVALRGLREERGLRQTDVAGLGERQVRRIEEGITRLRMSSAQKFAAAFGVPVAALLDELARRAGSSG